MPRQVCTLLFTVGAANKIILSIVSSDLVNVCVRNSAVKVTMGTKFSRMRRTGTRRGTRFSRRARRQISATEQTRVATTEAIPTPANGTRTETQCETDVTGTGHARQQIPAPEQTCVASISETCPTPVNGTRTETDTAGTGQGSSQPGECQSAHYGKNNEFLKFCTSTEYK